MKKIRLLWAISLALFLFVGCATTRTIPQSPPADSKFSRIMVGMSTRQMIEAIGMWDDHETKIHSYLPASLDETVVYYNHNGRVTLRGDKIRRIEFDPTVDRKK